MRVFIYFTSTENFLSKCKWASSCRKLNRKDAANFYVLNYSWCPHRLKYSRTMRKTQSIIVFLFDTSCFHKSREWRPITETYLQQLRPIVKIYHILSRFSDYSNGIEMIPHQCSSKDALSKSLKTKGSINIPLTYFLVCEVLKCYCM